MKSTQSGNWLCREHRDVLAADPAPGKAGRKCQEHTRGTRPLHVAAAPSSGALPAVLRLERTGPSAVSAGHIL